MNYWTQMSIDFANQRNYLDELFSVYPTIPEGIRTINETLWLEVQQSFEAKNNVELFNSPYAILVSARETGVSVKPRASARGTTEDGF